MFSRNMQAATAIVRFRIITVVLALIGLAGMKTR